MVSTKKLEALCLRIPSIPSSSSPHVRAIALPQPHITFHSPIVHQLHRPPSLVCHPSLLGWRESQLQVPKLAALTCAKIKGDITFSAILEQTLNATTVRMQILCESRESRESRAESREVWCVVIALGMATVGSFTRTLQPTQPGTSAVVQFRWREGEGVHKHGRKSCMGLATMSLGIW